MPVLRARTAREASASETRRSPLNALVVVVLAVAAIALLPLWRPVGPEGVPSATLSFAPQGLADRLNQLVAGRNAGQRRVWNPQTWGSWLEFAAPTALYVVDSRVELFPPQVWTDVNQVAAANGEWQSILDRYGVAFVVVAAGGDPEIAAQLRVSPAWVLRYEDADGSIWGRVGEIVDL